MGEGAIRFRRNRSGGLFWFVFVVGLAIAFVLHEYLNDVLVRIVVADVTQSLAKLLAVIFDGTVLLVLFGIGLPKAWGYDARKRHAEKWKTDELAKWGFYSRDREGPMINYVYYPVVHRANVAKGKRFYSEWLIIHDGCIIVNPGESIVCREEKTVAYDFGARKTYAWDGCTPKWLFWWVAIIGIPDWAFGERTIQEVGSDGRIIDRPVVWQLAHHASLVHDALCQYIDHIPLEPNEVSVLFRKMLLEAGMWWPVAWLYYIGVRVCGPGKDSGIAKVDTSTWQPLMTFKCPESVSG